VSRRTGRGRKKPMMMTTFICFCMKERRKGTKSGVFVQARKAAACWYGCRSSLITVSGVLRWKAVKAA
jgi:hypothetical protein